MASELFESFLDHFADVDDPRTRESPHVFSEVVFIAVCATIANADGPSDIEEFGIQHESWFRKHIELPCFVPWALSALTCCYQLGCTAKERQLNVPSGHAATWSRRSAGLESFLVHISHGAAWSSCRCTGGQRPFA